MRLIGKPSGEIVSKTKTTLFYSEGLIRLREAKVSEIVWKGAEAGDDTSGDGSVLYFGEARATLMAFSGGRTKEVPRTTSHGGMGALVGFESDSGNVLFYVN